MVIWSSVNLEVNSLLDLNSKNKRKGENLMKETFFYLIENLAYAAGLGSILWVVGLIQLIFGKYIPFSTCFSLSISLIAVLHIYFSLFPDRYITMHSPKIKLEVSANIAE
jgi:hypothetical protein